MRTATVSTADHDSAASCWSC